MALKDWLKVWFPYQRHPDPRLQPLWTLTQLSALALPFSSLLGGVGILVAAIGVWQQRSQAIVRRPLNRGFAVLSGLMLLSAALAFKPPEAFLGLFNFLPFFFVFAALSELLQTPAQLRRLAWLLVVGSVPVVTIGVGQQFFGWAGTVQVLWVVLNWTIDPTGNPPGRMASIFFYANVLASYLAITLTLSVGLLVEALIGDGERQTANGKRQADSGDRGTRGQEEGAFLPRSPLPTHALPTRLFLAVTVLGNAIALILTDSRNAWAIAILACLAYALYLGWRWLLVGVGVVMGSTLGAAFGPSPVREWLRSVVPAFFWARLTDQLYPDRPVAELRRTQWQFAWSLAEQHPLTGWGLRNFSPIYEAQMHYFIGHPHNLVLMLAAETGLPATLLFLGLVGWVVFQGSVCLHRWNASVNGINRPTRRDRLICFTGLVAFMGCTLFSLLDITLFDVRINLLGWLLLSAIAGITYRHTADPSQ